MKLVLRRMLDKKTSGRSKMSALALAPLKLGLQAVSPDIGYLKRASCVYCSSTPTYSLRALEQVTRALLQGLRYYRIKGQSVC